MAENKHTLECMVEGIFRAHKNWNLWNEKQRPAAKTVPDAVYKMNRTANNSKVASSVISININVQT